MKNVLFVCNNLDIGGPQKGLIGLLDRLDPDEFHCTVVSLQPGGALRPYLAGRFQVLDASPVVLAAQINRHTMGRDLWTLARQGGLRTLPLYFGAILAGVAGKSVNPWRQRLWYSLRHVLPKSGTSYDAAFAVSSGLSTYYVVDCVDALRKYHWVIGDYSRTEIVRGIDLHYFRQLSGGIAVSAECAQIFAEVFPELPGPPPRPYTFQVPWHYYAEVECNQGTPEFDNYPGHKLVTVSRVASDKGLDLALEAAVLLNAHGVDFRWLILGDGNLREKLEKESKVRGLEERVKFCGFKQNVREYLMKSDVFILPSLSEGRSTAVDEAMAIGVIPVVTNYRTARSQVEDSVTGFISDFTAESLAASVVRALDPHARAQVERHLMNYNEEDPTPFFKSLLS